jgi:Fe-S cluster assembly protein SufD
MDLEEAAREHEELVRPHLANLLPGDGGKFEALNLAALSGGFFLYIPAGLELDEPIYLFNSHDDGARFSAPRILVVADRGSRATIFTEFVGSADSGRNDRNGFHRVDAVLEFFVGRSSRVSHVAIQRLSRRCSGYVTSLARLEEDSRLDTIVTSFGGAVLKMDTGVFMEGEGSEGELVGFAFGEGNQRLDHRTVYGHRAQHTNSRLDFKVVLKEEARSAYTGLLRISEDAPFCEAYQENRNILLSDGARADSIPELEILNEEVHCSHGATVGPIDPDEIFYLASRGIRKTDALRMVVGGFLEPTLTRIPAGVQGKIRRCVNERLSVL